MATVRKRTWRTPASSLEGVMTDSPDARILNGQAAVAADLARLRRWRDDPELSPAERAWEERCIRNLSATVSVDHGGCSEPEAA